MSNFSSIIYNLIMKPLVYFLFLAGSIHLGTCAHDSNNGPSKNLLQSLELTTNGDEYYYEDGKELVNITSTRASIKVLPTPRLLPRIHNSGFTTSEDRDRFSEPDGGVPAVRSKRSDPVPIIFIPESTFQ